MLRVTASGTARVAALMLVAFMTQAGGCEDTDSKQSQAQENMLAQADNAIGMPAITNFQERRELKQILELRDQAIPTITYLFDMNGHLHKFCDSVGYPIPASTQYTNPSREAGGNSILPQADPNGLFSGSSSEATYAMCLNPLTHKIQAVYSEPKLITSPFPMKDVE